MNHFNPLTPSIQNLIFTPLKLCRDRETQLEMGENSSYFFIPDQTFTHLNVLTCLTTHFIPINYYNPANKTDLKTVIVMVSGEKVT